MADPNSVLILGRTNSRNRIDHFGIKQVDRLSHLYVIGKTGVGKTTLIENMIVQDIDRGSRLCSH